MAYLPSKDDWRKKNLGEMYQYNKKLAYMSVPDRSIKLLVDHDIKLTENEWMCIKLHDGLYDQACLLYTSPSPRDRQKSRMPSSA